MTRIRAGGPLANVQYLLFSQNVQDTLDVILLDRLNARGDPQCISAIKTLIIHNSDEDDAFKGMLNAWRF